MTMWCWAELNSKSGVDRLLAHQNVKSVRTKNLLGDLGDIDIVPKFVASLNTVVKNVLIEDH